MYDDSDDHVIDYLNYLKAERARKVTEEAQGPEKNVSWVSMHMTLAAKRGSIDFFLIKPGFWTSGLNLEIKHMECFRGWWWFGLVCLCFIPHPGA